MIVSDVLKSRMVTGSDLMVAIPVERSSGKGFGAQAGRGTSHATIGADEGVPGCSVDVCGSQQTALVLT